MWRIEVDNLIEKIIKLIEIGIKVYTEIISFLV